MDRIAVLIPCYNEVKTVGKVVSDFLRVLPEAKVYVYDNNSTDGTAEAARKAGAIVRKERRQGKGNVVRRMLQEIDASCYIMADGDDTYPAEAAREMARLILSEAADMVVGDRLSSTYFEENKRPFHGLGNLCVRKSINLLFHCSILDIMTGYRAFSFRFAKTFPVLSQGFEIETEMSIHAADRNLDIRSMAIDYRDRPQGSESKLNTIKDGLRVIGTIMKLFRTYRPLAFFGSCALLLAAASLTGFLPILATYLKTSLVPRYPTLIVCGFLCIAALQSLFTGLELETLRQKDRQDFELKLREAMRLERDIAPQPHSHEAESSLTSREESLQPDSGLTGTPPHGSPSTVLHFPPADP